MLIHHDGPGRIILVTHEAPACAEPFAVGTRLGDAFAELLGAPAQTWFACAAVLPEEDRRSMPRHRYGIEARMAIADRHAIVVGKEAATLLRAPTMPLMIWTRVKWCEVQNPIPRGPMDRHVILPGFFSAPFPMPSSRASWLRDPENVDVMRQWLEEQGRIVR